MSEPSDPSEKLPNDAPADASERENFCYYPFLQLLLQPTGVVSPCCWNQSINLGKVPDQTFEQIWNGETLRKLRKEFIDGKPVSCATQMRHIKCHLWSRRDYRKELQIAEVIEGGPRRLDVRLNGKCNLQCVMCDVWKQPNGTYDNSDFWTHGPEKIFPFLKEIDVLGGEPFVQSDTFRLLDEVWAVNQKCTWAFVTNGNYKFGAPIRTRLDRADIRWIQISVDSVNPVTYPKIRVGGNLAKVLQTIEDFRNYNILRAKMNRPFGFSISMCVQQQNWNEIHHFLGFARLHGVNPLLQFAYEPDSTSLLNLPLEKRREIDTYLTKIRHVFGANILDSVYLPIADSLRADTPPPRKESSLEA